MNIYRKIIPNPSSLRTYLHLKRYFNGSLYEPDYLEGQKSKIPLYDTLNIFIRGYDYPILENYQKFLHNMIKNMDINVEECWANTPQHMQISTYKPKSEVVKAQYNLRVYERAVQITDVSTLQFPVVLRAIEASLPTGVTVEVRPHEESDEEKRYIPDSELNALKQELDDLGGPSKTKK
ncbi:hypothetical protein NQ314_005271 [Rhamnusium bicolor]|uniref:Small ribosomal subunit protein uS10 domain-containing protein n=1 Tax=Rhamnusium bicolor TaxID=1586634 RepID=A0AAV8ZHV8_9CUCU|nr:hypothetical protein NQ314_005271 [Rhamnusium bicolor]